MFPLPETVATALCSAREEKPVAQNLQGGDIAMHLPVTVSLGLALVISTVSLKQVSRLVFRSENVPSTRLYQCEEMNQYNAGRGYPRPQHETVARVELKERYVAERLVLRTDVDSFRGEKRKQQQKELAFFSEHNRRSRLDACNCQFHGQIPIISH